MKWLLNWLRFYLHRHGIRRDTELEKLELAIEWYEALYGAPWRKRR